MGEAWSYPDRVALIKKKSYFSCQITTLRIFKKLFGQSRQKQSWCAFDNEREEGDKNSWSNLLGPRGYKVMLHASLPNLPGPTVPSSYLFLRVIYCKLMHIHSA